MIVLWRTRTNFGADANMAGDLDGRKSMSRFLFTFVRGAVS